MYTLPDYYGYDPVGLQQYGYTPYYGAQQWGWGAPGWGWRRWWILPFLFLPFYHPRWWW